MEVINVFTRKLDGCCQGHRVKAIGMGRLGCCMKMGGQEEYVYAIITMRTSVIEVQ